MSLLRRTIDNKGGNQGGGSQGGGGGGNKDEEQRAAAQRAAMAKRRPVEGQQRQGGAGNYSDLKVRIQNRLLSELDPNMDISKKDEVRRQIQDLFNAILAEENMLLSKTERERLFESIVA